MPNYYTKTPQALDPKQNSVMEPKWKQYSKAALQGLTSFVGGSDPAEQAMNAAMPAPLVSIYKNAAARMAGTEAFKEAGRGISDVVGRSAERLAAKYPRIAAHMKLLNPNEVENLGSEHLTAGTKGAIFPLHGKVNAPIPMGFTHRGLEAAGKFQPELDDTLHHEATHVAQALGNSKVRELYGLSNSLVGYERNPFEVTANIRGAAARGTPSSRSYMDILRGIPVEPNQPMSIEAARSTIDPRHWNAIRGLEDIVDSHLANFRDLAPVEQGKTLRLDEILGSRMKK